MAFHAKALAPTDWQTLTAESLLFVEAEQLLLNAYARLEKEFGAAHARARTRPAG